MKKWQPAVIGLLIAVIIAMFTLPIIDHFATLKDIEEKIEKSFNNPDSDLFFNRKTLSDEEAEDILEKYREEGYYAEWDEDGYLNLVQKVSDVKTVMISYSKKWSVAMYEHNILPFPGKCWIRFSRTEKINGKARTYHYVQWTEDAAKEYVEYAKSKGYSEEAEDNSQFLGIEYSYILHNSEGYSIMVSYDSSEGLESKSCIMIEYTIGEADNE